MKCMKVNVTEANHELLLEIGGFLMDKKLEWSLESDEEVAEDK